MLLARRGAAGAARAQLRLRNLSSALTPSARVAPRSLLGSRQRVAAGAASFAVSVTLGAVAATSAPTGSPASAAPAGVHVTTYNVLSDSLCDAKHFSHCLPEDCDGPTRLLRVKEKLKAQMARGSVRRPPPPAAWRPRICLAAFRAGRWRVVRMTEGTRGGWKASPPPCAAPRRARR